MTVQALAPTRLPVLLDQQFWFLGHDIRHAGGNALQRFGFVRWRAPTRGGTSCYVYALSDVAPLEAVVCWGFAAYCGPVQFAVLTGDVRHCTTSPRPGVLFQRHTSSPRIADTAISLPLHRLADMARRRVPQTAEDREVVQARLTCLATLFQRYEQWVRGALGDRYRLETLALLPRHKQRRFLRVPELSEQWAGLRC